MLFSIIIPHHKETYNQIRPLLDSLNNQIGLNKDEFEVIVCNDNLQNIIYDYSLWSNLNIRNINVSVEGYPGLSRQAGIDEAKGDYLLFCDADDLIANVFALKDLKICINKEKEADIFIAPFMEELLINNEYLYNIKNQDFTWMFSKLYKREFLIKNKIRFSDKLKVHEDTYFNALFRAYNPVVAQLTGNFYVWRFNKDSITRLNNAEYSYKSLPTFIDALEYVSLETDKRNLKPLELGILECSMFIYMILQGEPYHTNENYKSYVPIIEERLAKLINKYKDKLDKIDSNVCKELFIQEYQNCSQSNNVQVIYETWDNFKDRILNTYILKGDLKNGN